ncbi:carbon-nitrogen hydrolase family protein [Rhodococcus erythropolis]|uniref:carbon-nitrogen hydrolase family protein n=1 Tax=Rhodococcus erythropolis TaxID=1833 RepID=UPI0027E389E9|nr:carbon-nitrogen hydrolase family protein [Rhodococcus erythropolis]
MSESASTGASVIVAAGQFAPGMDKTWNVAAVAGLAASAAGRGASLLALPEYSSYMAPELDGRIVEHAEPVDGWFAQQMQDIASSHGVALVVGMNERIDGADRVYNTVLSIAPDGAVAGTYRKTHLYDAFGATESTWIKPGATVPPTTMSVKGITVGVQTCYDLRFPEVTRTLVDAGADLVVIPAQWVPGPLKLDHWQTLLAARAIENTVYVCAADQAAPLGAGRSMVIDPVGNVLGQCGTATELAIGTVDPEMIVATRRTNPVLAVRRFAVMPMLAG